MTKMKLEIDVRDIVENIDMNELEAAIMEDLYRDNPDWFVENFLKPLNEKIKSDIVKGKCDALIREYVKEEISNIHIEDMARNILEEAIKEKVSEIDILELLRK